MKALDLIDMREHKGGHPRLGAVDVIPFVPIQGMEMEEAVQVGPGLWKGIGEERNSNLLLRGGSHSSRRERICLRFEKGSMRDCKERLNDPNWKPDEGPDHFNPKSGATVVGARFPLVAYNVNLKTEDLSIAKEIAKKIRFKDGGFPHVRAMGVDLREKGMVQVSMNLTNYRVTNIPKVYEFIKGEALEKGIEIEGSEIVGLIPLGALEGIAQYYLQCPPFSVRQEFIEQRILEFE